ncbi:MAG: GMC family oxidoreductase N-terminal domain-containing protein [Amylibacter sp.]|jgi:choline dehydrogenase|tara:strand:- start:389 stop:1987 length:1599 start_codon:yes stop_codon:yes gene_type:complete
MAKYDYIIVGAGTAGATLASRLTEDPNCKVLILEGGGSDRNLWLKLPVGYYKSIYNPKYSHLYRSEPEAGINGRRMDCPRGQVIGGSSSINGLIYIRGQREDFDDWADLGADGWDYNSVLPHFRNLETYDGPPSQYRGAHGPLQISNLRTQNPACSAWLAAAGETGLPYNEDFNAATTHGLGSYQLTLRGRWRDSAATAFLKPAMHRPNLTVKLHARVTSLSFIKQRVSGVSYRKNGKDYTVTASTEVILSGGAVQTPQLLQLSGIGPTKVLEKQGIKVRYDSPEVGENLQDHVQMRTIVELSERGLSLNDHVRNPLRLAQMGLNWLVNAKGPLTVGAGQVGGAICTKYAEGNRPDLQLFVMPLSVDKPGKPLHRYPGFTTSFWQCHPESRGSIHIKSTNPMDDPRIIMNYFQTQLDRDVTLEGLKILRNIYRQPSFKSLWSREIIPGDDCKTDDQLLNAIRANATTVYHLVGTCRMGNDNSAVVDPQLRVKGIEGLRVVDASVMPSITSANTNSATYMIAEKAASMIQSGK